ncbi:MAG: hypothetical protein JO022_07200 [Acidobacteriaceae bacterium]|nr:hypothetical protein [Acidobacteriaceae bacterium]
MVSPQLSASRKDGEHCRKAAFHYAVWQENKRRLRGDPAAACPEQTNNRRDHEVADHRAKQAEHKDRGESKEERLSRISGMGLGGRLLRKANEQQEKRRADQKPSAEVEAKVAPHMP